MHGETVKICILCCF